MLDDLGIEQDQLKIIYDSIYLEKKQVYHAWMKHMEFRFYFVREILEESDLVFEMIHTKENPADMLIKMVLGAKFNYCKNLLHILSVA